MLRLAHTTTELELEADSDAEESVTVAEACRRLGCDQSTVYALLDAGELTGHRVGKCRQGAAPRGVRVHAIAIRQYKLRHTYGACALETPPPSRRESNPPAAEARRRLRELGVV